MARAPVPVPQYPNVPKAEGVPSVFRDPQEIVFTVILLAADVATILRSMFAPPQWGLFFDTGSPVIAADSIISVDYRQEWRPADYPLEKGGFESYDKVMTPYDVRLRAASDGTNVPRELFLSQLDTAANSLELYTVLTPEAIYPNMTITHVDYRRDRRGGVTLIQADIWLSEIRETITTEFTNTKEATGAATTNTGAVQPVSPTPSQAAAAKSLPVGDFPVTSSVSVA